MTSTSSIAVGNNSKSLVPDINNIGEALTKIILKDGSPSPSQCIDLLTELTSISADKKITISILEETMIGKKLTKGIKSFKRHKRSAESTTESNEWQTCITEAEKLIITLKQIVSIEQDQKKKAAKKSTLSQVETSESGLTKSVATYKTRLVSQKKEMYKDPPVLPPATIVIEEDYVAMPKRSKSTGELSFTAGNDDSFIDLFKDFKPNRSPEEVLRFGSFGGTYFRSIVSAVTNIKYKPSDVLKDSVKPQWIKGLDARKNLTSSTYSIAVNKFQVKCGGSLGMWESSGWISDSDPYGWFQWYCRFYQGRRCADDKRQIGRWLKSAGPKGRFRSQLCNKILAAGGVKHFADVKISPVIRQTLLHWGLEITEDILRKHAKRVGKR